MATRPGEFWATPGLFGFNALAAVVDAFGTEATGWLPETLELEIRDEWGVDCDPGNFDRLMTAVQVATTDAARTSPVDFGRACASLAGHTPAQDSVVLPDAADVAWGITEMMLIDDPGGENPLSPEVVGFVAEVLRAEGIMTPPDVLRVAGAGRELADRVSYDYSDDPDMFSAISAVEADKTSAIEAGVRARLKALLGQLADLPLRSAANQGVARKLLARLGG